LRLLFVLAVNEKQRRLLWGNGSVALSLKPTGLAVGVNNPPTALNSIRQTRSGILDHCSGEPGALPRQIGAGWNSGFVIHATERSADCQYKLGAGKIQLPALSSVTRRTPIVVRGAIHDAVVCWSSTLFLKPFNGVISQ
jgi:hypothetical protein